MNDFLGNFANLAPNLAQIIGWSVALIGFTFFAGGLLNAAKISNGDAQAGGGWSGVIISLAIGSLLIGIPEMMKIFQESIFGERADYVNQLTAYVNKVDDGFDEAYRKAMIGAFAAIQLIGWLAFIKGWIMIKTIGDGRGGNASFSHAVVFIASGILAVNIGVVLDGLGLTPQQILSTIPMR
jgi:hypothetical protein